MIFFIIYFNYVEILNNQSYETITIQLDPWIVIPSSLKVLLRYIGSFIYIWDPGCPCEQAMIDSPPNCRLEYLVSTKCSQNTAYMQQSCRDTCPCGPTQNVGSLTITQFVPAIEDFKATYSLGVLEFQSQQNHPWFHQWIHMKMTLAACSFLPGNIGSPPNCWPECLIHSEGPSNRACINEKCRDPCPGVCGAYANCLPRAA